MRLIFILVLALCACARTADALRRTPSGDQCARARQPGAARNGDARRDWSHCGGRRAIFRGGGKLGRGSRRAISTQCANRLVGRRRRDGRAPSPRAAALAAAHAVEACRSVRGAGRQQHRHRRCGAGAMPADATPQEAVTRYFLTHYVSVCERFNFSTAESDYEECGAFHSAQRNQAWYRPVDADQSGVAAQRAQGRQQRARTGQFGQLLHARERTCRTSPRCAT